MSEHQRADRDKGFSATRVLSLNLQRAVQILCATYVAIDLRLETTMGCVEDDFVAAMPEVKRHERELRQLVRLLIADLTSAGHAVGNSSQPILLRFAYQDHDDLVEQLLSGGNAHIVVVPLDSNVSHHAQIKGENS